jgi:hypothetical protein
LPPIPAVLHYYFAITRFIVKQFQMVGPWIKWYDVPSTQGEKAMGQILHGTATTTHATRAKIQVSEASIRKIAEQYNINPKTAHKWKNRDFVDDLRCGCKPGQGSVLTDVDDAVSSNI